MNSGAENIAESGGARAKGIFNDALALRCEQRAQFVRDACAGDARLRTEVDELLRMHDLGGRFLAAPTAAAPSRYDTRGSTDAPGTTVSSAPELANSQIGPYRLLERIGEGGFGSVYMAEQREPVQRRVALKLIKLGMDTKQVIARFEAERQALARMEHPNIAKVLDAGATDAQSPLGAGRPYFVMELVKGVPITRYCDEHQLATRARLGLFADVCHAVQHAHQKGVIHRDLKPSNVIVSRYDDGGASASGRCGLVKIIDFGIAKAVAGRLTEKTVFTELQQLIGTPAYMSPEQAGLSDLDIDTRSDIYSLGVLLYELLTGTTPFDAQTLVRAGYDEMRRIIREVEPPRPSTRLSSQSTAGTKLRPTEKGGRRGHAGTQEEDSAAVPPRLRASVPPCLRASLVRGDLDWIVMKCLEKDRNRRYETANGLAADVQRHLAGEPVVAAPPSKLYRLRRAIRRYRLPLLVGTGVVVLLASASVVSTTLYFGAERERQRADDQARIARAAEAEQSRARQEADRERAQADAERSAAVAAKKAETREREKAEKINEFVSKALISSDPNRGGAQAFLVTDAMQQAIKLLDAGELKDQPETEADLLLTISHILSGNARSEEALRLAERALETNQGLHAGDHPDVALSLDNVAGCLDLLGRSAEALPKFEAALEMYQRLFQGDHPDVALGLNNVAFCLRSLGRSAEALPKFEAALEMRQRVFQGDHPHVAMGLGNVASCLVSLGRPAEALPKYEAALEMCQRLFQADHPDVARSLNNVAYCLRSLGRSAEALPKFEAALEMWQRLFQGDHPGVAGGLNNVAFCLDSLGRSAEALPKYEAALEMTQRLFQGDHPNVAMGLNNVAYCLDSLGRWAEALPKYEAALEMRRRVLPPGHPHLASTLAQLGVVLLKAQQFPEAEPVLRESLAIRQQVLTSDSVEYWLLANTRSMLGGALAGQGAALNESDPPAAIAKFTEAEPLLLEGNEWLSRNAARIPQQFRAERLRQALERVVKLYEAWDAVAPDSGKAEQAGAWRAELEKLPGP